MLSNPFYQKLWDLATAAEQVGTTVTLPASALITLVESARHGDEPDPAAPRPGPCWCNGPHQEERHHHNFCRLKRRAWQEFLRVCALDVDAAIAEWWQRAEEGSLGGWVSGTEAAGIPPPPAEGDSA